MWLRMLMAFALPAALFAFPFASSAQETPDEEWQAVQDAFTVSMSEPAFQEAAWSGRAFVMKDFLVHNGAPADMVLSAEGFSHESTAAAIPLTIDRCARWRIDVWYEGKVLHTRTICLAYLETTKKVPFDPR